MISHLSILTLVSVVVGFRAELAKPTPAIDTAAVETVVAPSPSDLPVPGTVAPAAVPCCPQPCIRYRHAGPRLCGDRCLPSIETVLKVKHPCICCEVDVPLCVPGFCTGEPKVCFGTGLLGRNVVEYEWCCGYRVKVVFRHCGDLLVTTWGR